MVSAIRLLILNTQEYVYMYVTYVTRVREKVTRRKCVLARIICVELVTYSLLLRLSV